ncbi:hypothetical protein [Bacillus xiapuensis]|uniref:hypothetical protein n=1 Tax=Bacillus xiapuensis TaxID=2014075 RepID=UPI000C23A7E3|nr:hypothetical protein [Bacillus xiapuensis]
MERGVKENPHCSKVHFLSTNSFETLALLTFSTNQLGSKKETAFIQGGLSQLGIYTERNYNTFSHARIVSFPLIARVAN